MSLFPNSPEKLKFAVIAIAMMIIVHFILDRLGWMGPVSTPPLPPSLETPVQEEHSHNASEVPRVVVLRNVKTVELSQPKGLVETTPQIKEAKTVVTAAALPKAVKTLHKGPRAKVVIIIDDMGMTAGRDQAVLDLPGKLTLAYLPYAPGVAAQAKKAKARGHELLIHTPMEPMNGRLDMGPIALRNNMGEKEFREELRTKILPSFEGYIGINNHMGSRLTQNPKAMGWLMEELKKRDLAFVDSVTIPSSIAADVAQDYEVPFAVRDVFLDHFDTEDSVHKALRQLERRAHEQGYAVAIGHPKAHTIRALQEWLPGIKDKGLELVPLSVVLEKPWRREAKTASSKH
ncbi:MAG: divergent polysaccharide deacetylase family protein [Alphaproteobacteria bacterium]|nr:divergent polysaccharide deacetylase family protein [Alphaproteobacteria bacterium]MCD8520385.1 divergent polysaccharide deacetylase family protein [Alphaproteobacteria bacterium]MCD8570072.1 divergent polysaccharide deacetylase family protein [Alphaproteobacteria bacterium]